MIVCRIKLSNDWVVSERISDIQTPNSGITSTPIYTKLKTLTFNKWAAECYCCLSELPLVVLYKFIKLIRTSQKPHYAM